MANKSLGSQGLSQFVEKIADLQTDSTCPNGLASMPRLLFFAALRLQLERYPRALL